MSQKNISKFLAVFSLLAVAVTASGCGAAATDSTNATLPTDTGAAMTPSDTGAGGDIRTDESMNGGLDTTPPATTTDTMTPPASNPPAAVPAANKSSYKDGTYTADGSYRSPGGTEGVGVTLTLKNDVITKVTVVSKANDPMSTRYQGMFIAGISDVVVGKKINEIKVSKISGSSLTAGGFNDAVVKIEAQAKNS